MALPAQLTAYSHIRIETPENVEFTYELAGPGSRMAAYLLDFLFIQLVYSILTFIVYLTYEAVMKSYSYGDRPYWIMDIVVAVVIATWSIVFWLGGYWTFFEMFWQGQTPGKRILGLRVINRQGTPSNLAQILTRNLMRLIDCCFPFQYAVGTLAIIFSRHAQRLGDQVSGTIVVRERKKEKAPMWQWQKESISLLAKDSQKLDLTREEFDLLIEYVRIREEILPAHRARIAAQLVAAIADRADLWNDPAYGSLLHNIKTTHGGQAEAWEVVLKQFLDHYLNEEGRKP